MPVNAGCCCYAGQACPAGVAGTYTTTCPTAVTWGSCTAPPACVGSSLTSVTLTQLGSSCDWTYNPNGLFVFCFAGYKINQAGGAFVGAELVTIFVNGCAYWGVTFNFQNGSVGVMAKVVYVKKRGGAAVNDITGTYDLLKITDGSGNVCAGATANATITVS